MKTAGCATLRRSLLAIMPFEDSHRGQGLYQAKLRALVRPHADVDASELGSFPGGAALVANGVGWVLVDERPARSLGGALAWGARVHARQLNLIAGEATGVLARRATCFREPPVIWAVVGTTLIEASPEPVASPLPLSAEAQSLAEIGRAHV